MEARLIVAIAFAAGCHRAPPPGAPITPPSPDAPVAIAPPPDAALPLPLDRDPPALVARELALLEQVADAIAAEGSCAARATSLDAIAAEAAPVIAARQALLAAGLAEAREAALAPARPRLTEVVDRIAHDGRVCATDAAFARALDHALAP